MRVIRLVRGIAVDGDPANRDIGINVPAELDVVIDEDATIWLTGAELSTNAE